MNQILSLGCEIPGGSVPYLPLDSGRSLLDADIVVLEPNFGPQLSNYLEDLLRTHRGKRSLSERPSFEIDSISKHWKRELGEFIEAGGIVFVNLSTLHEFYIQTGEIKYSGTGHNRVAQRTYRLFNNYELIPSQIEVTAATGTSMKLDEKSSQFEEYWATFRNESHYKVYLESEGGFNSIVRTHRGNRVVGAVHRHKSSGALVLLPWIEFDRKEFTETEEQASSDGEIEPITVWSSKATNWGNKYVTTIQSLSSSIRGPNQPMTVPQWVQNTAFKNQEEINLRNKLSRAQKLISNLNVLCQEIEGQIVSSCSLKYLLYENGYVLERAVIESMRILGFKAEHFQSAESEFDVVLEYGGERYIGEVEGRDKKLIDIRKMRQLAMNIKEDFGRDEVTVQAKGILFGNAHRLIEPAVRPRDCFTDKCLAAAKQDGTILIKTCDLFIVANYVRCNEDPEFAESCRNTIFTSVGKIVVFPSIPS